MTYVSLVTFVLILVGGGLTVRNLLYLDGRVFVSSKESLIWWNFATAVVWVAVMILELVQIIGVQL